MNLDITHASFDVLIFAGRALVIQRPTADTLTAYVVTSLIESKVADTERAISDAFSCIEGETFDDAYTTALVAYAYARYGDMNKAQEYLDRLMKLAVRNETAQTVHWEKAEAETVDVTLPWNRQAEKKSINTEMTAYALLTLTLIESDDSTLPLSIVRWLTQQQNSRGGFTSTQDTVIALQALSQFAMKFFGSQSSSDITVSGDDVDAAVSVSGTNSLVQQLVDVPSVPSVLDVTVTGSRCVIIKGNVFYNLYEEQRRVPVFSATANVMTTNCKTWQMTACGTYTGEEESSNMAIISVNMVTGFSPVKESLNKIFEKPSKNSQLKRFDIEGKTVDIYVNEFEPGEQVCVTFDLEKYLDVENVKSAVVKVYDYYEPEQTASTLYSIEECK
ncbi:PREDICTED: alpha-2-macroglobulin-like [Priapulus caudatus]|uniref:Alpha-2-macroglobulin-like n=1 Tax=Priapulus caudatus TaxID=37621 RepID=A0ABM1ERJ9_PRICU|nr:PREDICTED: alpha-2-macroglobulin-like [Priapulus caudatus]